MLGKTVPFTSLTMFQTLEGKTNRFVLILFLFPMIDYVMAFSVRTSTFSIFKAIVTQIIHEQKCFYFSM